MLDVERGKVHRVLNLRTTTSQKCVKRFRRGLVFKAHRLLYHSTLGLRVIKEKKKVNRDIEAVGHENLFGKCLSIFGQHLTFGPKKTELDPPLGACLLKCRAEFN